MSEKVRRPLPYDPIVNTRGCVQLSSEALLPGEKPNIASNNYGAMHLYTPSDFP